MCLSIPGRVTAVVGDGPLMRTGKVSFGGILKDVNLSFVPEAAVGDYVLVHVGVAISVIDAVEAARVLEVLDAIDAARELGAGAVSAGPSQRPGPGAGRGET